MIYQKGIYQNIETLYKVKIWDIYKKGKYKFYVISFLNNPSFGKYQFTLPAKGVRYFMKGYRKLK